MYLEKVKMKHTKVKPRYLWACTSDVIWFTDWSKLVIVRNCNKGLEWNHCSQNTNDFQELTKVHLSLKQWIVRDLQYIKTRCLYTTADWYICFVKNELIFESFPRMKCFFYLLGHFWQFCLNLQQRLSWEKQDIRLKMMHI